MNTTPSSSTISQQPPYHERPFIRRQILRILVAHVYGGQDAMRDPTLKETIIRQSYGYDNVLYKRAVCMEDYGNLETLQDRVLKLVAAMIQRNQQRRRLQEGMR